MRVGRSVFIAALVAIPLAVGTITASAAPADPVRSMLGRMTLEEKVGQLFVDYVYGDTATTTDPAYTSQNQKAYGVDTPAEVLAKYHLGGVIYFTWSGNLNAPTQIAGLSDGLQKAAMAQDPGLPLLISTDQEGGTVTRLGNPVAVSPGNMAIGATFSPTIAYRTAAATAQQLRALGINTDDAPVVDVNTNPANTADETRSFGDNAGAVSALTAATVAGYQRNGIVATAKHFPGLGSTTTNTDTAPAVTNETRAEIFRNDIPPFRAAIGAGTGEIMAAHIVAPALDPTNTPASLSKPIVTGILRNQLHYNGVVITDSLSAAALSAVPPGQRAVEAVQAGDDQLLMPEDLPAAYQAVLDAVHNGTISEHRIDQSVSRILTVKFHRGLFTNPYSTGAPVGTASQNSAMAEAANRSITLVKNDDGVLPLTNGSGQNVLITGWGAGSTQTLTNAVATHGVAATRLYTGTSPSAATIAAAVAAAKQNDVVVVTTSEAWGNAAQQALVNALLGAGKPVVVAALGTPYDIGYVNSAPTFLAAYGYQTNTLTALANTIFGANPRGHLPVTVPLGGDVTKPLYRFGLGLHY